MQWTDISLVNGLWPQKYVLLLMIFGTYQMNDHFEEQRKTTSDYEVHKHKKQETIETIWFFPFK